MKEIQELQDQIHQWSNDKFGYHDRTISILNHLSEELKEVCEAKELTHQEYDDNVKEKIENLQTEFADCFMLLLDSAANSGLSVYDLYQKSLEKHKINQNRQWGEMNEQGYYKHKHDI